MRFVLTPEQCRAGRALLNWTQEQLAEASGIAKPTIADYERGARNPYARTIEAMQDALESAGVLFIDKNGHGPGVRLRL